jgi:hypothetical protein
MGIALCDILDTSHNLRHIDVVVLDRDLCLTDVAWRLETGWQPQRTEERLSKPLDQSQE